MCASFFPKSWFCGLFVFLSVSFSHVLNYQTLWDHVNHLQVFLIVSNCLVWIDYSCITLKSINRFLTQPCIDMYVVCHVFVLFLLWLLEFLIIISDYFKVKCHQKKTNKKNPTTYLFTQSEKLTRGKKLKEGNKSRWTSSFVLSLEFTELLKSHKCWGSYMSLKVKFKTF